MMKSLIGIVALAATAASPAPKAPLKVTEMFELAVKLCPMMPSGKVMREVGDKRLTRRDADTMIALCALYTKGRADQARKAMEDYENGG
jgi:hypothetical protein